MKRDVSTLLACILMLLLMFACTATRATPEEQVTETATEEYVTQSVQMPDENPTEESSQVGSGPCVIISKNEVAVYTRPSLDARLFGSMPAGFQATAEGRTESGWLGFDPGVAQAANIGVFRLRWVQENDDLQLKGTCDDLPILVGLEAGYCFTMPMGEVEVYAEPDTSAEVLAIMDVGDYAALTGKSPAGFHQVDLMVGSLALNLSGWIAGSTINMNGPCEDLPAVEK